MAEAPVTKKDLDALQKLLQKQIDGHWTNIMAMTRELDQARTLVQTAYKMAHDELEEQKASTRKSIEEVNARFERLTVAINKALREIQDKMRQR